MGAGVRVAVAVAVGTDVGVAVELGRILATGEGVGSSEHPGRTMARSIAPASSTLLAMDFDIFAPLAQRRMIAWAFVAHDRACRPKSSPPSSTQIVVSLQAGCKVRTPNYRSDAPNGCGRLRLEPQLFLPQQGIHSHHHLLPDPGMLGAQPGDQRPPVIPYLTLREVFGPGLPR